MTLSTVSYRLRPSPEPSIFFFEPEPTSCPSSQQISSDYSTSTLYNPFSSYADCHHLKGNPNLKTPPQLARGTRCARWTFTPSPQQILTAGGRSCVSVSRLSAQGIRSDFDDATVSETRLRPQLNRTAVLLAKNEKQRAMLADPDAFEVEVVYQYPLPPLLIRRPRPLWAWLLRKGLKKWQAFGCFMFCIEQKQDSHLN